MLKLLIFDLDGTLFDTTRSMAACGNAALEHLGIEPVSKEVYAAASGGGVREFVMAVLYAAGQKDDRLLDAFWDVYIEKQRTLVTEELNRPYPGIRELLAAAKEKGLLLAAYSNKDEESVVNIVRSVLGDGTFDLILGCVDERPPKPDPTGARLILDKLGIKPEEALYLGDTEIDMETANRAGIPAAGVLWGYRTKEQLAAFHPAYLPESPGDILKLL
ncbi:MAG: HAD family hydrolase [Clostridia bacterium]|nr:HAD family hydrolase [Clostridia bacterium]